MIDTQDYKLLQSVVNKTFDLIESHCTMAWLDYSDGMIEDACGSDALCEVLTGEADRDDLHAEAMRRVGGKPEHEAMYHTWSMLHSLQRDFAELWIREARAARERRHG